MLNNILSLTKKLISFRSTSANKKELERILQAALTPLGRFNVQHFKKSGAKSILVYNSKKRPKRFKILLNGHLDVIPGKNYQYNPKIRQRKIFGLGAMDMKASVACLILVFKELANKVNYPLGLQLVTDEEIGGFNGTKYQIDSGVRADFVIVGESTNLNIENKAKGILWVKISTSGKTSHGAYPWNGENAIWKMNKFLNLLEKEYPVPHKEKWITTINLSKIETDNKTFNKIPDNCSVLLDIRYVPEESSSILDTIKKLLPKGFHLETILNEPALSTNKNNKNLKLLQKNIEIVTKKKALILAANGSSDVRHFTRVNCAGVEFGPIGDGMGSDNEWVDIKSLETYYKILKNFLLAV